MGPSAESLAIDACQTGPPLAKVSHLFTLRIVDHIPSCVCSTRRNAGCSVSTARLHGAASAACCRSVMIVPLWFRVQGSGFRNCRRQEHFARPAIRRWGRRAAGSVVVRGRIGASPFPRLPLPHTHGRRIRMGRPGGSAAVLVMLHLPVSRRTASTNATAAPSGTTPLPPSRSRSELETASPSASAGSPRSTHGARAGSRPQAKS